jgi:UDP-N-acetylglucosamine 2-epimerase (non-hydrolysing)
MVVFGTRPEAIKMAPLIHALKAEPELFDLKICVTAQHRQMLDRVLEIFEITPDIDLNLMKPGQDLGDVTSAVLQGMQKTFLKSKPDVVLVHGDTSTTLATAMAAYYSRVPIGHVEAGLRTYNINAPFPEEFNRQVVSKVTRWHFAPTELSRGNLLEERVSSEAITVTGNTVIDALFWVLRRIDSDKSLESQLATQLNELLKFDWCRGQFVLVTGHRRENFGYGFLQICEALRNLAINFPKFQFVYPLHLNPRVQEPVLAALSDLENVHLIRPLDYDSFVFLLKHCYLVLTDSGGIQEEAPSLGKPVLVMRELTERPEAIQAGTMELVGADRIRIVEGVSRYLNNQRSYDRMVRAPNPYGDGSACERIVAVLRSII